MSDEVARLEPVSEPGNTAPRPVSLGGVRLTIGRAPGNAVVVNDPEISKRHAEILREGDGYFLKDLGSSNGTFVNGRAVAEHRLAGGDVIEMGSCRFTFSPPAKRPEGSSVAIVPQSPIDKTQVLAAAKLDELMPGNKISEIAALRDTYERVRSAFGSVQELIEITDIKELCARILEVTFKLVSAQTGAVLLFDERQKLVPWATRSTNADVSANIVVSRTIVDQVIQDRSAVLASDALTDSRFSSAKSVVLSGVRSLMCVPLLNVDRIYGILHVGNSSQAAAFLRSDLELVGGLGTGAGVALSNAFLAHRLAEEARTRESLGRFLSPELVEQVVQKRISLQRGGELKQATILFADIRGFTSMTERSKATDVVALLNEYFDQMVEVIFRHHGILDKFIGDAIMAAWGSLVGSEDDGERAVAAAREMQETLIALNDRRVERGKDPIEVGIGIASGECVAGAIGARRRLEFTLIGDAVNLAARLCSLAKAGEVICDQETFRRAGMPEASRQLPPSHVKGKQEPVSPYLVWEKP